MTFRCRNIYVSHENLQKVCRMMNTSSLMEPLKSFTSCINWRASYKRIFISSLLFLRIYCLKCDVFLVSFFSLRQSYSTDDKVKKKFAYCLPHTMTESSSSSKSLIPSPFLHAIKHSQSKTKHISDICWIDCNTFYRANTNHYIDSCWSYETVGYTRQVEY